MNNLNQRKERAVSARVPKTRPQSSKLRKLHQKTQFIQNVYNSNPGFTGVSNGSFNKQKKIFPMRPNCSEIDQHDLSRLIPKAEKMTKDREELFEQNLHLKKEVHKLLEELAKGRTKIQTLTAKNSKYTKQFNREFEKKMYWNGNSSYMISGIKAQYDRLKAEFQQKNQQYDQVKRQLLETRAPELKIYCDTLQQENQKLVSRINKMTELSQDILFDNTQTNQIPKPKYTQLKQKYHKLEAKLEEKDLELKLSEQENKSCYKKIQFLQKLIIEKQNNQHNAVKRAKKLERQNIVQNQLVESLKNQVQDVTKNYVAKIQKLRVVQEKRFVNEKSIFERALSEGNMKIKKLQKQVAYLSTLLSYWKPLDEMNRNGQKDGINEEKSQILKVYDIEDGRREDSLPNQDSRMRKESVFERKSDFQRNNSEVNSILKESVKPFIMGQTSVGKKDRVRQTADERFSEEAEKKRKVSQNQVEHLGEHLRFRFLGLRLSLNKAKKYFDCKNKSNPEQAANFILNDEQEGQWQEQYITMKQTIEVLKQYPFELPEEDAYLLARYLIEDSNNEYMYVDLNNQHKRMVIKSILRALLGDYEILNSEEQEEVEKECEVMMSRYQTNLLSALSTVCPSGFVSRRKFLQLVNSLGIELSNEGRDLLVCKMLLKSQSLNKLSYMIIF